MEPIDIYLMYCAMKAHFGHGKYDFVQYEGKTKVSRDSFFKRKDRYFFARLAKKYNDPKEIQNWLLSNFVKDRKGYIANFSDENYDSWRLKREGFFDMFAVEMHSLVQEFEPLFEVDGSNHPKLLKEYLGKRVSIETMIVLEVLVDYCDNWDKHLGEDIVWQDTKKLMKDYNRFLTIDPRKYKMKLLKLIEEFD